MNKYEFIRSLTDEQMSALFENFEEKQPYGFPNYLSSSPCDNCSHPTQCEACPYVKKMDVTCN